MRRDYIRPDFRGITVDVSFCSHRFLETEFQSYVRTHIIRPKGNLMSIRRLYRNGNSWVLTLSADLLNHMEVLPGNYIRVETAPRKRLRLSKAPPKITPASTAR